MHSVLFCITVNFLYFLPAGLRAAQPCRYCFYSVVQKWVFRPAGAIRNVKFGVEKHTVAPHAKFHIYRGRNVGIQPPKLAKFGTVAINLPPGATRLHYFLTKFSALVRVYR